ncbi:NAD(P)/FAD-dependent oxidoreductase [Pseudoalteromonas gelatinilytica]|uniref:Pyridine nucleotide-disulfide oxidoreductase n=1 Tax=Pseudoalteromonas gelatinilytica TaxID=1703256 RepID=A0ABQ1TVB8_9GAMM|nr:FAD-dependent oxidoreductase [Pseudoalteromonas profundi]GGF03872.1 pyridine nucleotide-disulfide oxidoreductase [Pseudoalteromonas profundi]
MNKEIVIIGAGFAGMWAALSAARLAKLNQAENISISVIAPVSELRVRPRLYEENVSAMIAPLMPVFNTMDVQFIAGSVSNIDSDSQTIKYLDENQLPQFKQYDRLVLASGSNLRTDLVNGIDQYAFNLDQIDTAAMLEQHLKSLAKKPASQSRNTVIVCGGGFTGIEMATELPARLKAMFSEGEDINVIVVERNEQIGSNYSPELQAVIKQASDELGITWMLNTQIEQITDEGLTLSTGERILADTVIWTAGVQANALTNLFQKSQGPQGRLNVESSLKVNGYENVFATGDVAYAKTDDKGNHALMTCQHAILMGKFAGHNVAASLLDLEPLPYKQENYVTCLDLGSWGAVYTEGWDQVVKSVKDEAKKIKVSITNELIYPPAPEYNVIMEQADPLAPWV